MLSTGEDHPWFLFSYILLLDAGAYHTGSRARLAHPRCPEFHRDMAADALWTGSHYKPEKQIVATVYPLLWVRVVTRPFRWSRWAFSRSAGDRSDGRRLAERSGRTQRSRCF